MTFSNLWSLISLIASCLSLLSIVNKLSALYVSLCRILLISIWVITGSDYTLVSLATYSVPSFVCYFCLRIVCCLFIKLDSTRAKPKLSDSTSFSNKSKPLFWNNIFFFENEPDIGEKSSSSLLGSSNLNRDSNTAFNDWNSFLRISRRSSYISSTEF